jgi:predicted phosphodiesterase
VTVDPLATPRRIAIVGDLHMNARWTRKAIKHAIECMADVVIQVGDFGYTFDRRFLDAVDGMGMPVLFVDGNHEDHDWLAQQPVTDNGLRQLGRFVWHIPRGFRWEWDGVRFLACGGAYSVDRQWRILGDSWWPGEETTDADVDRCIEGGQADILISHDAPSGFVIPTIDDRTTPAPFPPFALAEAGRHRQQLRRVVDAVRPWAIWHGHYHHAYNRDVDFGYGPVSVTGIDCDETTLGRNVQIVDLDDLVLEAKMARAVS